jgi:hypothetical protein
VECHRPEELTKNKIRQEREDLMTLSASQSVGLCHHTQAGELMAELIAKADVFFPNTPLHLNIVE